MTQYNVTGMHCAACSARIEKVVGGLEGVKSCTVSLLTNSMTVEGSVSEDTVISAVEMAGFGASVKNADASTDTVEDKREEPTDGEYQSLKKRLIYSVGFLAVLMYISMGHTMLSLPLPSFMHNNFLLLSFIQLILSAVVIFINREFFISGVKGIINKAPNMDTLVSMGSGASYLWSLVTVYVIIQNQLVGNTSGMMNAYHGLYFESAAMILTLITVGKMLEAKSKGKTTTALRALLDLKPKKAKVLRDGKEVTLDVREVKKGDVFLVYPGESVPVDGVVIKGESAVNEAALTGESVPVDKTVGDTVSAATVNKNGFLTCEATAVGEETLLSKIIRTVEDAAATKAPIAKIADKVSGVFVPTVIIIAVVTTAVWLFAGQSPGYALARGISVLVISCPCALGLATPVAIMVGNGAGAKKGILFKSAEALEVSGKISIAVLDKTGTVTKGEPELTDVVPCEGVSENELLKAAYSLESKSEHPLGKAIVHYCEKLGIEKAETADHISLGGKGLEAMSDKGAIRGGKAEYISEKAEIPQKARDKAYRLSCEGKTPMYFSLGNKLLGIIAVSDVIKEDSAEAVKELRKMGVRVVMLTGDNENTAKEIARQAGIDEVVAGVLPDEKERVVRELQEKGTVAMIGDGINDAPALTRADVGVAIGAGTDIAIEAADVVLMKSNLKDAVTLIKLSRRTLRIIHQNLFWAFFYNALGIPLAAGVFIPVFGWTLSPMFGAAAMSLSSFCVVSNALRLRG